MNQITNEERRKVAEIMRNEAQLWHKLLPGTYINLGETSALLQDIMHFVGINGRAEPETIYNRLADLINRPTCKNVSEFGSHTVTVYDFEKDENFDFVCSRCGIHLDGGEMGSSPLTDEKFARHALRYCPNCGAEVVE